MVVAYMLLNCKRGHEVTVKNLLERFDHVKDVSFVFGAYDIIIKLESSTLEDIRNIITNKIRKMDIIVSTVTLIGTR